MRAVASTPEGVVLREVRRPSPGKNEVLVRVAAASLNRADLFVAAARSGKPFGMEWAGEVVDCGPESPVRQGHRVLCTGIGGFAEFAVTDAGRTIPVPESFSFEEATVLGGALQTMHDALVSNGRLRKGEAVLINHTLLDDLGAAIAAGTFRLPIDATYDLDEAAKALAHMESNRQFGKIVLRVAVR